MKRKFSAALAAVMLTCTQTGWATDAASAQAYCDEIKKASQDAQARYVQIHTPRVNPVQTFDDAVASCLDNISKFDLGLRLPGLGDLESLLNDMIKKLMQRACQSATGQFDRAVNDATQTVNGSVAGATGGVVAGPVTTGHGGTGATVTNDNGSAVRGTVETATDRVINFMTP